MTLLRLGLGVLILIIVDSVALAADWHPAEGRLMTRWAAEVSPENAWPEYPRPQMVRDQWRNLNGLWQYSVQGGGSREAAEYADAPETWDGEILVPFCIDSALSGVMRDVAPDQRLWYRCTFERPAEWDQPRTLLNFGAVDWQAVVWVNGQRIGAHEGGYDPFSFDITDALKESGEQELVVAVWDPTDAGPQPCGKQVREPHGIWYTPVTGIWQTVWLEPVPETYIRDITITPDLDSREIFVNVDVVNPPDDCMIGVFAGQVLLNTAVGGKSWSGAAWQRNVHEPAVIRLRAPSGGPDLLPEMVWMPETPRLVTLNVVIVPNHRINQVSFGRTWRRQLFEGELDLSESDVPHIDVVGSYTALRKIEKGKDGSGFNRLLLNDEPLFQFGPLDQGWWPDGLYTAPTDEALRYDIEVTKRLGFNMCRKHVKVEPARWYYWCDKLGLMVWQDMPSGDRHIRPNDPDIVRSEESEEIYREEWEHIIDANRDHPCIVAWVPFNEGWGQFKTNDIIEWTGELDPTRLVDGPSGWADRGVGDMHDMHKYPGPGMFAPTPTRVSVLGEFGGLGLPLEGHTWLEKGNWGYRSFESREALSDAYEGLVRQIPWLIGQGLSAAVYTQTTDVEVEVNGLMTYDREVIKFDPERLASLHAPLYGPPPTSKALVPTSEAEAQVWRYTTQEPAAGWSEADFDDSAWKSGEGGFGTEGTPGTHVRTTWNTPDIWLRRTFTLEEAPSEEAQIYLRLHHDEDAEIYVNGEQAATVSGYVTDYITIPVTLAAAGTLHAGANSIAIHCKQTGGGQYIDAGIVVLVPPDK